MEFELEQITMSFFFPLGWLVGLVFLVGWFGVFLVVSGVYKYREMSYLNGGFALLYVLKIIKLNLLSLP